MWDLWCIASFIILIIELLAAIWVYKDANYHGESGLLWFVIVLVVPLVGLILWLVLRPRYNPDKKISKVPCIACGREIPVTSTQCPFCGKQFNQ